MLSIIAQERDLTCNQINLIANRITEDLFSAVTMSLQKRSKSCLEGDNLFFENCGKNSINTSHNSSNRSMQ